MKAKQIEKLLKGVVDNFLSSIEEEDIKHTLKHRTFITGGAIPSMLMDEWVNDYDIYFYSQTDADKVRGYFERRLEYKGKFHVNLLTENAINLSDKIQLITKFVGNPENVVEKFDWQHIKSWYCCKTEKLHLTPDVYQLVVEKELIYTGSDYPLSSLMRLKKYIKKGWNVSNTTILHIALDFVEAMNKAELSRKFEQSKKSKKILDEIYSEIKDMSEEDFEQLDNTESLNINTEFEIITDPELLEHIDIVQQRKQEEKFNVDDIIYHLNGVDPITIQAELKKETGQYKTIKEIIDMINRQ